jgi:hypothetical protein
MLRYPGYHNRGYQSRKEKVAWKRDVVDQGNFGGPDRCDTRVANVAEAERVADVDKEEGPDRCDTKVADVAEARVGRKAQERNRSIGQRVLSRNFCDVVGHIRRREHPSAKGIKPGFIATKSTRHSGWQLQW